MLVKTYKPNTKPILIYLQMALSILGFVFGVFYTYRNYENGYGVLGVFLALFFGRVLYDKINKTFIKSGIFLLYTDSVYFFSTDGIGGRNINFENIDRVYINNLNKKLLKYICFELKNNKRRCFYGEQVSDETYEDLTKDLKTHLGDKVKVIDSQRYYETPNLALLALSLILISGPAVSLYHKGLSKGSIGILIIILVIVAAFIWLKLHNDKKYSEQKKSEEDIST